MATPKAHTAFFLSRQYANYSRAEMATRKRGGATSNRLVDWPILLAKLIVSAARHSTDPRILHPGPPPPF